MSVGEQEEGIAPQCIVVGLPVLVFKAVSPFKAPLTLKDPTNNTPA